MNAALRLLARREHAAGELAEKLRRKGHAPADIDHALQRLQAQGLQSDRRYAEILTRTRVEAGYGPLRIRQELARAGVEAALIDAALEPYRSEWVERAESARRRRFRGPPPRDYRERARQARHLLYRGFPAELVRALLDRGGALIDEG